MTAKQSAYYSTVQSIMSLIDAGSMRQFQKLTTDEEKVSFIASLDFVRSAFSVELSSSDKSTTEAKRLRQKGNEFYKDGNLKDALNCYNKSIIFAPVEDAEKRAGEGDEEASELALAYGNRSATLLQMKMYAECLDDIDQTLFHGYPFQLRYKLLDRKGRCLVELGRTEAAEEAYRQLLGALADAQLDPKQLDSLTENATKMIESCSGRHNSEDDEGGQANDKKSSSSTSTEVPIIFGNPSERYPGASESFDVRYNPDNGRYGMAAKDVTVGEVVLVESPYASVLSPDLFGVRCYHCFRSLNVPTPCRRCTKVRYCSETCQAASWEACHEVECPCLDLLLQSRTGMMAQLAVRLVTSTGMQKILRYKKNPKSDMNEAQQSLFTNSDGVYLGGYMAVYSLLTHANRRSVTDRLQYTILAVWLARILGETSRFGELRKDDRAFAVVGGILLRFLQIISCNGIEITEMLIGENLHKSHPSTVGLALYPTASLLNHSCDPVLELVFYGGACALRAIQNIRTGQDLVIDYGYVYYTTPKDQRQAALKSQYFFDCQCIACVFNWGLRPQLRADIPELKCYKCGDGLEGPPPPPTDDEGSTGEVSPGAPPSGLASAMTPLLTCHNCGLAVDSVEMLECLYQSQSKADEAIQEARKYRIHRAIPVLEGHLTFMSTHLLPPWREYVTCLSVLKQCYRMRGNRRRR